MDGGETRDDRRETDGDKMSLFHVLSRAGFQGDDGNEGLKKSMDSRRYGG